MPSANVSNHLANERTFLAWVRTSVALLGFGVVIAKLGLLLSRITLVKATAGDQGERSLILGIVFCLVGLATLVFSLINYMQTRRMIDAEEYRPPGATLVAFVVVVGILAIASIVYLVTVAG